MLHATGWRDLYACRVRRRSPASPLSSFRRAAEPPASFERTETRERCTNYTPTRRPFFGELHLHTVYSADAATVTTRNTPFDAYRYARGEKVGLPPFVDTRTVKVSDAQPATGAVSAHPYCLPPTPASTPPRA